MWRRLDELLKVIPENKWKHFRKHRFKCRFVDGTSAWARNYMEAYGFNFRLGQLYKSDWNNSYSVNLVPLKHPSNWTTSSADQIEVFINNKAYIEKLAPIVLSQ